MSSLTDSFARLIYIYVAEFMLGIILFFVFRRFSVIYRKRFLLTWALSWMAFSLYMLANTVNVAVGDGDAPPLISMVLHVTTQLGCFIQVVMILRGTHEMVSEKALNRRKFRSVILLFLLLAILLGFIYDHASVSDAQRRILWFGSISITSGLGFLITGIVVWLHRKFSRGFGQRMLAASFVIYSFYQLYYLIVVVFSEMKFDVNLPVFYGVADLLLVAVMGMSMMMWLSEDERQKLEKAHKELDHFMHSTSHDLRAPIASILGLTYLGKVEFQEEKARLFMDMIEERIKKLDAVISDILNLSRTRKFEVKMEPLQLEKLLDDVVTDIKFNKNASAITLEYQPSPAHVFKSDYSQMKIVLCNLIGNAIKYHNLGQPDPYIRVNFKRYEDYVTITVADNGRGIAEEKLPKIFDMFYRASTDTDGTGLGLYIVNEALNKVKGSVTVESTVGKGSTFTIFLDDA